MNEDIPVKNEQNLLAAERTLLAAERTFSAWIRTGLAAMGGGFAVIKLISFEHETHRFLANLVGEILIIGAFLLFIYAFRSYQASCRKFETATGNQVSIAPVLSMTLAVMICSLILFYITI